MVSKTKLTLIGAIAALGVACWYMTQEQCEQAVNYHGFCVTNPDVPRH
jgi:hypothetical protein